MELTDEHIEILKHTRINGIFCGDSKEMDDLCSLKMMRFVGRKSFVPDGYYKIEKDGISFLQDLDQINNT